MATGEAKAGILRKTIEEPTTDDVPASYLQTHANCAFYIDTGAAERLTRTITPWRVFKDFSITSSLRNMVLACQALCRKTQKPLFSLTRADFEEERLALPIVGSGSGVGSRAKGDGIVVDQITRRVYETLMSDKLNEEKHVPRKGEKVIVFSPHPDDDVISMGGMLDKMHSRECEIKVAYCVNGSVSVCSCIIVMIFSLFLFHR